MFRNVPGCSGMFYVPGFIDAQSKRAEKKIYIWNEEKHPRRPRGSQSVFKHRRKSPWVPTLTGPFPNGQVNAGS